MEKAGTISPAQLKVLRKHQNQLIQTSSPVNAPAEVAEPVELEDIESDEQQQQHRPE